MLLNYHNHARYKPTLKPNRHLPINKHRAHTKERAHGRDDDDSRHAINQAIVLPDDSNGREHWR